VPNAAGVMASAVHIVSAPGINCTEVLREPFNDLSAWTLAPASSASIVGGRTGTGVSIPGSSNWIQYTVPVGNESDIITVGFAWRCNTVSTTETIDFMSTGSNQCYLIMLSGGALEFRRSDGTVLATSSSGVVVVNTWYYIELQVKLHDTTGFVKIRVNDTLVINTSGIDTLQWAGKTTFNAVRLTCQFGQVAVFDDLYVSVGPDCTFKGSQEIVSPGTCNLVLQETFNNFTAAPWAVVSSPVIIPARTGNGAEINSISDRLEYTIPTVNQSDTVTVGFAWKTSAIIHTTAHTIISLNSDTGSTTHTLLRVNGSDGLAVDRAGTVIASSASAIISANIWYYIEIQFKLGDSPNGYVKVRVNGNTVIDESGLDTKNAGTKTVYDTVRLLTPSASSGGINHYDDMYISTGSGCAFKGDHTIGCDSLIGEPFDNLSFWTEIVGTPSIVTGRNGNGVEFEGVSTDSIFYTIPTAYESNILTMGFAWKTSDISERVIAQFQSEGIVHVELATNASGGFNIRRGTPAGNIIGTGGGYTTNTWYYIEWQCQLKNTGFARLRVNGTLFIDQDSVDTRNGGTKTKFDRIGIGTTHTRVQVIDDLYLSSGVGCGFQGDTEVIHNRLLQEPFNNLTTNSWTTALTPTIVAGGRTGNGLELNSIDRVEWAIPAPKQSDYITAGVAFRTDLLSALQHIMNFYRTGSIENMIALNTDGTIAFTAGNTPRFTTTATGLMVPNTWYYVEVQYYSHLTVGWVKIRINGTEILNGNGVTRNNGTPDQLRLNTNSLSVHLFDDLYLSTGKNATFQGDHAIA
jgi:hypothetical protein